MDGESARELAERDQLWASLRELRAVVGHFADGAPVVTEQDRQIVTLLARIVAAEMDFRARNAEPE